MWSSVLSRLRSERELVDKAEQSLFDQIAPPSLRGLYLNGLIQRGASWKESRRSKITASNFGVIAELSEYVDAHALWGRMTCTVSDQKEEDVVNPDVERGVRNESKAVGCYERGLHKRVRQTGLFTKAYLGASPDGLIENEDGVIEVKCPRMGPAGGVSKEYMAQVQGALAVCNREFCDFISFHELYGFNVFRVYRSREYFEKWLLPQLDLFYFHVCSGTPPLRRSERTDLKHRIIPSVRVQALGWFSSLD